MRWFLLRWPQVGLLLAAGLVVATAAAALGPGIDELHLLLVLSLVTLMLHQGEEYVWPGGFPQMVNRVVFDSDQPDRFPLDQRTAWIVNVALGWTAYAAAAVVADAAVWVAIATLTVSAGNVLAHTLLFNIRGRTLYNPGLATSWLLFVPIIVWFVVLAARDDLAGPVEIVVGVAVGLALNYLGVIRMITVLGDRETAYPFPPPRLAR